ncbi:hypothetical protein BS47DRAFT_1485023 [Hydnum rufescens UP504]|uniref:Uncharacterized protein n=1 Tax=Hydnum rufescens UP504 TaxID=1448309 RepID=A0A9P6DUV3_9AGAM|nr:hypothetical protein BS47DRAFT_1485023 [Hydnum rufescens UP504]
MKTKASAHPFVYPARTPVRTKRRSVTSNISAPPSPTEPTPLSNIETLGIPDYAGLIAASAPIMFSTPLERGLLNSLGTFGFDTGQIVYSVLTDAYDSTGAIW